MIKNGLFIFFALLLSACSSESDESPYSEVSVMRQDGEFLAHEHFLSVALPAREVKAAVTAVIKQCQENSGEDCTVLASEISQRDYPSGSITLRSAPELVDGFVEIAGSLGEIEMLRTTVEDLAETLADYEARLAMLNRFREELERLENSATQDVDSLIKIAEELTATQSELEKLTGEQAYQIRRTQTDILDIRFSSFSNRSFWAPIRNSVGSFGNSLSEGISSVITGAAFVIPWSIFLIPVLLLFRKVWRKKWKNH